MPKKQQFYTLWLILIIISLFILQLLISGFTDIFFLSEHALTKPWQFITAMFLHGSISHLIYNLFALFIFGFILEQLIGSKRFLILFIGSGILANLISFWFFPNALGASGAIMAIIGVLAILKPLMGVWAFGMILPMFIVAIIWIGIGVFGLFGLGDQGVGHLAHISGIIIGAGYGIYLRLKKQKKSYQISHKKIEIPDNLARRWENSYMNR